MARGVADVLALYLDERERRTPPPALDSRGPSRPCTLWAPRDAGSVIESFVIWNLNRGLSRSGRRLSLRAAPEPVEEAALLLLHSSRRGLQHAALRLELFAAGLRVEVVVYGERDAGESETWTRRLAERVPRRRGGLVHRGGVETGHTLARSILRREAIVEQAKDRDARHQWLAVCARLGQTETREHATAR